MAQCRRAIRSAPCRRLRGQEGTAERCGAAVDEAAHALIEQPLLHSASIGVVYRGKTFIRHRGEMVAGKPEVPTDATLYEIGSLSKTLAGTLMARAVLEGRVGLEDDVRSYLQGDYPNLQYQGQPIRVRHLLSHTSGLPNMLPERANTVLEDFTDHRVPGELSALYAHYGKPDFLRDLHAVRHPLYAQIAHFTIDTGRPSVSTLVNMIVMQLELAGMAPAAVANDPPASA